jgi:hypothetical protein
MSNLSGALKFLYRSNLKMYKNMLIVWLLFLVSVIITSVIKLPDIAFGMTCGLISLSVTFVVVQPFVNQYFAFPYSINLGYKRNLYLWGMIIINFLTAFFLLVCIYTLSAVLSLLGAGYSPINFPSVKQAVSFTLISAGLTGITTLVSLIFYRLKLFYGLSFLLLLISPFMYFRYKIIEIFEWRTYALLPSSAGFLVIGILAVVISNAIIKSTEVR